VPILAKLSSEYGTKVDLVSQVQRREIFAPIFGKSDSDSFSRLRDDLIIASKAFAERVADNSIDMLREVVRTAHRPFKDYLVGLHGDSVKFSKDVALSDFTEKTCYPILRNAAVAAVFGIAKLGAGSYPYATDAAEDILIEAISAQLGGIINTYSGITRERISCLQRLAIRGAEAIATAIDYDEAQEKQTDADLDLLISKCYSWGAALATMQTQPNRTSVPVVQANPALATMQTQSNSTSVPIVQANPAVASGSSMNLASRTTVRPPLARPVVPTAWTWGKG
jgi:hypothetical protein